ncbi:MAG: ABC transporter ATP-binding protein [Verrucomicrobiae bacterium]|nr:ABC transporter ATP-binding protein [Verrucomicrobiae bacterium]
MDQGPPLLRVQGLTIAFPGDGAPVEAVRDVSFDIARGETVAMVGESGSGKSVTALSLARLLPSPPAEFRSGKILFDGRDVFALAPPELRSLRGGGIAYVFQEPGTSLNPVFRVDSQIAEAIRLHRPGVTDIDAEIVRSLDLVGIRDPALRMRDYPHQLSGGMQQRVMIAMALACQPKLLVADEPTTALDVTIQKQVMDLLKELRSRLAMTILLITHNFGIVSDFADRVLVMYRGRIVEQGPTRSVLRDPRHPYTRALIDCIPRLGAKPGRLKTIDHAAIQAALPHV